MENQIKKCSSKIHLDTNAICFCKECRVYMCKECQKFHSSLLFNHHQIDLDNSDKDINLLFTGICDEENHPNKLEFYCKDHNKLCCGLCIIKIEKDGYGQHTNCNVCTIENINKEKRMKLDDNIKCLKKLYHDFEKSMKELQKIFDNIKNNKETLKINIQKIFSKIRSSLNDREDEILLQIDEKFNELFFNENLINESKQLSKTVKINLEKGESINNEWDENDKLNSLIHDCIMI